jgi:hypothetical protein
MSLFHFRSDLDDWTESPGETAATRTHPRPEVSDLLERYFEAIHAAGVEPLVSLKTFLQFYGAVIAWELGLLLLPVVALLNLLIWLFSKIRRIQSPRYVPAWGISWTVRAAKSVHRGEIPLLKFFINRNLVRLFALLHMRGRIRELAVGSRVEYVLASVRHDERKILQATADAVVLDAATMGISRRAELKLLLLLLPALQLLAIALRVVSGNGGLAPLTRSGNATEAASGSLENFIHSERAFLAITTAAYLLMFVVSCYIRKRELFHVAGIYDAERQAARVTGSSLSREFPLDLVGWVLVMLLVALPSLTVGEEALPFGLLIAGIYALPFIYALVRRIMIGQR